jgi:uncharacterized protein
MELALQVVGLKMTGKIEDAKNVAMRIVGGAGENMSQNRIMANNIAPSTRELRPLLVQQGDGTEKFEEMILKFLRIMEASVALASSGGVSIREAISYQSPSTRQNLLHLSAFLGFKSVVQFLVDCGIDPDTRDRNGYTALHYAAFSGSKDCARVLINGGADREIVNNVGQTAKEVGPSDMLDDLLDHLDETLRRSGSEDEEAHWGDAEEDAPERVPRKRRSSRKLTTRQTARISRPSTPPASAVPRESSMRKEMVAVDEKQQAWFTEMIQRTLAQIPGAAHLHIPNLPGIVPWGALPQFPMVMPIFVPMLPGWSRGGKGSDDETQEEPREDQEGPKAGALKAAQEWRTGWEKLFALLNAAAPSGDAPPVYTARAEDDPRSHPQSGQSLSVGQDQQRAADVYVPSTSRRLGGRLDLQLPAVTEQDVRSYGYERRPQQKKRQFFPSLSSVQSGLTVLIDDRMLILFWIPILFSTLSHLASDVLTDLSRTVSMIWAMHNGFLFIFQILRTALPPTLKSVLRM